MNPQGLVLLMQTIDSCFEMPNPFSKVETQPYVYSVYIFDPKKRNIYFQVLRVKNCQNMSGRKSSNAAISKIKQKPESYQICQQI